MDAPLGLPDNDAAGLPQHQQQHFPAQQVGGPANQHAPGFAPPPGIVRGVGYGPFPPQNLNNGGFGHANMAPGGAWHAAMAYGPGGGFAAPGIAPPGFAPPGFAPPGLAHPGFYPYGPYP
ncbi:hypothetical protein FA95DRAFT_1578163 [Auriscalpium vulgare]|uniref:Uncharacterized protein n=1 Tax=Auriscalpium vulgare TaxID=40419 RepID=A0ACB8R420_9AGAM|nr:hypothetical protein FA95DRAFT_1578163 [Auriscalpium vulgare]